MDEVYCRETGARRKIAGKIVGMLATPGSLEPDTTRAVTVNEVTRHISDGC